MQDQQSSVFEIVAEEQPKEVYTHEPAVKYNRSFKNTNVKCLNCKRVQEPVVKCKVPEVEPTPTRTYIKRAD